MNETLTKNDALRQAKDDFIAQWGAIGSAWGINRTMAQIHAMLLVSAEPKSTDDIMDRLSVSRGNAHGNLKELIGWGLIRSVIRKGERKEYFEAEKDVWKIFCTIARERKRRELTPAIAVLDDCKSKTKDLKTREAKAFTSQMNELREYLGLADRLMERIARSEQGFAMKWAAKFLS